VHYNNDCFPAPLKSRPYGAIQIYFLLLLLFFKPTSTKPQAEKTRLDIQNYDFNGNLLCYHGVVERNRISSLQSHGNALLLLLLCVIDKLPMDEYCIEVLSIRC